MHLFISDLDGTLLDPQARITPQSARILNRLLDDGLAFTVATARTAATVTQLLADVRLNLPVVLMNGASVYDLKAARYLHTEAFTDQAKGCLIQALRQTQSEGFIYAIDDHQMTALYEQARRPESQAFLAERKGRYRKPFEQVTSFETAIRNRSVVYFSTTGTRQALAALETRLSACQDLALSVYRDVYRDGFFYLEAASAAATKASAVHFLKNRYGFARVTSFGDNLNDLPLFAQSDAAYAVANALPEVKDRATGQIGANTQDGVARWLQDNHGNHKMQDERGSSHESL